MLIGGAVLYAIGAVVSALAPTLPLLLAGRFLWGCGAAGTRVVSVAIIRDTYSGDQMARAMSTIMAVFVLVPVVSPSAGAGLLLLMPWRGLFAVCAVFAALVLLWSFRLPESWPVESRIPLRWSALGAALVQIARSRVTVGYILAMTFMFGSFVSYLASSELIVTDIFDRGPQFPIVFGVVAAILGVASLINGRLVKRVGLTRLMWPLLLGYVAAALLTVVVAVTSDGRPDFWLFFALLTTTLIAHMMLIPNMNSLAMEPVGEVAGVASAVVGTVTSAGGAALGAAVDHHIVGTVTPLAIGLLAAAVFSALTVAWIQRAGPASVAS